VDTSNSSASLIRDIVARADRRARARDAMRTAARVAPILGGILLVVALAARLLGWPPVVPLAALGAVLVAVVGSLVVARRARPASDAIAARIDADASLAGELRSAHWFASGSEMGDWTAFHVEHAARRANTVDWTALYPPVRATRAWVTTAACAIAVVALSINVPARAPADSVMVDGVPVTKDELPEELKRKLDALMMAMEEGKLTAEAAEASLEQLKDLMANIDPALQKKLEAMLKNRPLGEDAVTKRKDLDEEDLAEIAEKGTNAGLPEDVRWSLEDLAARLANSSAEKRETNPNNQAASSETGEKGVGSEQAQAEQAGAQASMQMQMVKEAAADPGMSQMMMGGGAMGGDSRAGAGGNSGKDTGELPDALLIAKALKKDVIEAAQDIKGENVDKEDIRRKTEQGKSTMGFTRAAPPATFERGRADAPPPVPEARRDLLQRYFIRR
jgi:hypothetical protein